MKRLLFILSAFIFCQMAIAQPKNLERVEPTFWWVGMKNTKLQLVVYGNRISDKKVSFNYPGISLTKVNKVENPNYLRNRPRLILIKQAQDEYQTAAAAWHEAHPPKRENLPSTFHPRKGNHCNMCMN